METSIVSSEALVSSESKVDEVEVEVGAGADDELEPAADALTRLERTFLQRVLRFLVGIQIPLYTARAMRQGYSNAEHAEGWRHFRTASGAELPLGHRFQELKIAGSTDDRTRESLQALDTFENSWFPRTRAIIRRYVPRASREAFEAAFFKDLEQQPLGPGVVGSVGDYVTRVESLAVSDQPGAKEVARALEERGLTPKRLQDVRALLAPFGAVAVPMQSPPAEEIARAQARQREGLADLRDWFNDWSTTLRPSFGVREQQTLGLTVKPRPRGGDEEGMEEEAPSAPPAVAPV